MGQVRDDDPHLGVGGGEADAGRAAAGWTGAVQGAWGEHDAARVVLQVDESLSC